MNKDKNRKNAEKRPQEDKIRRKDTRMIDNVLKGMEAMEEPEKHQALIAKYTELYDEYRNSQNFLNAEQKKSASLQQENEHLTSENNKLVLVRNRLEKLSREFQRQNKLLKEENLVKIKEEEERRRQITVEFQKALGNVTNMMAESNDQNCKLGEENKNMAKRLSSIYEEVKNRQTEVDRFSKQIDIERQLAETRFAKISTEFLIEKEKLLAEKEILKKRAEHLTLELRGSLEKSISLEKTIAELRTQLNGYTGRYEEFQKTISKSSKIFDQCKSEIANMNDQIYNQKKELLEWQSKHQKNLNTIRELSIVNDQKGKFIDQVNRKQSQLAKLCRHLQAERTAYINALRTNGHNPDDFVADLTFDDTEPEVETFKPDLTPSVPTAKVEKEKPKRGKQKSKEKSKDAAKRNQELNNELFKVNERVAPGKDTLAVKERHLADLKEELKKMQTQVDKIQSNDTDAKHKEAKDKPKVESQNGEVEEAPKEEVANTTTEAKLNEANDEPKVENQNGEVAEAPKEEIANTTTEAKLNEANVEPKVENQNGEVAEAFKEEVAITTTDAKPKEANDEPKLESQNGEVAEASKEEVAITTTEAKPKEANDEPKVESQNGAVAEASKEEVAITTTDAKPKEADGEPKVESQNGAVAEAPKDLKDLCQAVNNKLKDDNTGEAKIPENEPTKKVVDDQICDQIDQAVVADKADEVQTVANNQENDGTKPIEDSPNQ